MQFRPCIDIHNGKVKQIVGGSLKDAGNLASENFVSEQDAAFYAHLYKESGIKGGHIILLNKVGTPEYEADLGQARLALSEYPGGLQIGGGVNADNAAQFIEMGASHVIVTSYVFREGRIDYDRLDALVRAVGREHLVLDLSCRRRISGEGKTDVTAIGDDSKGGVAAVGDDLKVDVAVVGDDSRAGVAAVAGDLKAGVAAVGDDLKAGVTAVAGDLKTSETAASDKYYIVTDRWQRFTEEQVSGELLDRLSSYADEFLVHAVDVEGKASGVEGELVSLLSKCASIPVTYAGGVGSYDDIKRIRNLGEGRVNLTIGSALDLFGGSLNYDRVLSMMD